MHIPAQSHQNLIGLNGKQREQGRRNMHIPAQSHQNLIGLNGKQREQGRRCTEREKIRLSQRHYIEENVLETVSR
jgi:hypothetical protein